MVGTTARLGLLVLGLSLLLPLLPPTPASADPTCGPWQTSVSDDRVSLSTVHADPTGSCEGTFLVKNDTALKVLFFSQGGFGLAVQMPNDQNATANWVGVQSPFSWMYLSPDLDLEYAAFPVDRAKASTVAFSAEPTPGSLAADTAFFLIRSALEFTPIPCTISADKLVFLAVRVSTILAPVVADILAGDFGGAQDEIQQLWGEFLSQTIDAAKSLGIGCGVDQLATAFTKLVGDVAIPLKIAIDYLTWIPVVFVDYAKFAGAPATMTLRYAAPNAAATMSSTLIAYAGADGNIWVMNSDGSGQRQVTTNGSPSRPYDHPRWSPDGTELVFDAWSATPYEEATVIGIYQFVNGATQSLSGLQGCQTPMYSQNASELIAVCAGADRYDDSLATTDPAGQNRQVLLPSGKYSFQTMPATITYVDQARSDGAILLSIHSVSNTGSLAMIDANGKNGQELIPGNGSDGSYIRDAVFTPDGKDILGFWCGTGCNFGLMSHYPSAIRLMTGRVGPHQTVLALPPDAALNGPPAVAPDSQTIAYAVGTGLKSAPCVVVAGLSNGTSQPVAIGNSPAWQPAPAALSLPEMSSAAQSLAAPLTPDQIHHCQTGLYDEIDVAVGQLAEAQKDAKLTSDLLKSPYVGKNFSFRYDIGHNEYHLYLNKANLQAAQQEFQIYLATYGIPKNWESWFKEEGQTIIEHLQ